MFWVDLIIVLAALQFIFFGIQVAKARTEYGVKAPAMAGHEMFERAQRVHLNTLELLIVFFPAVLTAARYWRPEWIALAGAVYLVGRFIYQRSYMKDPGTRTLGFSLSMIPILLLLLASLVGAVLAGLKGAPLW
jgi:uncharacterized MAPEG superfamily protein